MTLLKRILHAIKAIGDWMVGLLATVLLLRYMASAVRWLLGRNREEPEPQRPQPTPEGGEEAEEDGERPLAEVLTRRRFLSLITVGAGGLMASLITIPPIVYALGPLLRREPTVWRDVGAVEDFQLGETVLVRFEDPSPEPWAGGTAESAAFVRRVSEDHFLAFSIYCTHMGCPTRWIDSAQLFMCPCHGGVFKEDGAVAAGPPPRPLARHEFRIRQGRLELQTKPLPLVGPVLPFPEEP